MKITKSQLKQIIKEELSGVLNEAPWMTGGHSSADIEREEHEAKTLDLPGGLMDEPRRALGDGRTAKERADETYMVKQLAKDVADNVESMMTDPKEYLIDPALARVTRGIESALDRGSVSVATAWDKLKRISKELERARWIQATRPDPRPGGTGDWPLPARRPPVIPRITRTKTGGTRVEEPMEIKPK